MYFYGSDRGPPGVGSFWTLGPSGITLGPVLLFEEKTNISLPGKDIHMFSICGHIICMKDEVQYHLKSSYFSTEICRTPMGEYIVPEGKKPLTSLGRRTRHSVTCTQKEITSQTD